MGAQGRVRWRRVVVAAAAVVVISMMVVVVLLLLMMMMMKVLIVVLMTEMAELDAGAVVEASSFARETQLEGMQAVNQWMLLPLPLPLLSGMVMLLPASTRALRTTVLLISL